MKASHLKHTHETASATQERHQTSDNHKPPQQPPPISHPSHEHDNTEHSLPWSIPLIPDEREGAGCELGASAGPAFRASRAGAAEGITKALPTASEATAATSATIIVVSFIVPLSPCLSACALCADSLCARAPSKSRGAPFMKTCYFGGMCVISAL